MKTRFLCSFCAVLGLFLGPVAIADDSGAVLRSSDRIAWSVRGADEEIVVRMSPARQTLAIGGTIGNVLGKGIDTVANDRYQKRVRKLLEGFDTGAAFVEAIGTGLASHVSADTMHVAYLGSAARFSSFEEAASARLEGLSTEGHNSVLDLKVQCGLFGVEGLLVAKIQGTLLSLPEGRKVWGDTILIVEQPILGTQKLKDPTKQFIPNFTSPRLTVKKSAVDKWMNDGGVELRSRIDRAIDGAVTGMLASLGLSSDPVGEYYLGKMALQRKKFDRAEAHFLAALELDPDSVEARNGLVVTLAHSKRVEDAVVLANSLARDHSDYGPAWHNLAWLYALKQKDGALAAEPYARSLELGLAPNKAIAKRIEKDAVGVPVRYTRR